MIENLISGKLIQKLYKDYYVYIKDKNKINDNNH